MKDNGSREKGRESAFITILLVIVFDFAFKQQSERHKIENYIRETLINENIDYERR